MLKQYPDWTSFNEDETSYGSNNISGFGVYRFDPETYETTHAWPDLEGVTQLEYEKWVQYLKDNDYDIPQKYKILEDNTP
jgi:hypothetical protein